MEGHCEPDYITIIYGGSTDDEGDNNQASITLQFVKHGTAHPYQIPIVLGQDHRSWRIRQQEQQQHSEIQYVEVQVMDKLDCGTLAIGLTCMNDNLFYSRTLAGWRKLSFGWHSDSDLYFSAQQMCQFSGVTHRFGVGDRIGIGLIYPMQHLFLVLNDRVLGKVLSLQTVFNDEKKLREEQLNKQQQTKNDALTDEEDKEALKYNEKYEYIPGVGITSSSIMFPNPRLHIAEKPNSPLPSDLIQRYTCPGTGNRLTTPGPIDFLDFCPVISSDSRCTIKILPGAKCNVSEEELKHLRKASIEDYQSITQEPESNELTIDEDEQRLIDAVKNTSVELVQQILDGKYVDVNVKDPSDGKNLMDLALGPYIRTMNEKYLEPCLKIVDILKSRGAKMSIFDAALIGDLGRVKECIEDEGMYIDIQNNAGKSALHRSVIGGHIDVVRYLIQRGCYIDLTDPTTTALNIAAMRGNEPICEMLIDNGANVHVKQGRQNLVQIVTKNNFSRKMGNATDNTTHGFKIIKKLVEHGCDPFYYDTSVQVVDIKLSERPAIFYAIDTENVELFELFIDKTLAVEDKIYNYRGMVGESLLQEIIARYCGSNIEKLTKMIDLLDNKGYLERLMSMTTDYGETVFHFVAAKNMHQILEPFLLKYDQCVRDCDCHGLSPLSYALGNSSKQVQQILLKGEADVELTTRDAHTKLEEFRNSTAHNLSLSLRQVYPFQITNVWH